MSYQWVLSATAAAIVVLLYEYGGYANTKDHNYAPGQDGTNPNWDKGKPIKGPVSQDPSNKILPQCQIWNETYQAFVHAGDANLDESMANCFDLTKANQLPRYLDSKGIPKFEVEDPLQEPDQTKWGTCYFADGHGGYVIQPPSAIVNRDDRLCFAAGDGLPQEGYAFKTLGGLVTVNPALDASSLGNYDSAMSNLILTAPIKSANPYSVVTPDKTCQEVLTVAYPNSTEITNIWANTDRSKPFDGNMNGCISRTKVPSRYIQNGNIFFQDPITKETLIMPLNY